MVGNDDVGGWGFRLVRLGAFGEGGGGLWNARGDAESWAVVKEERMETRVARIYLWIFSVRRL
jgi:hypothetical protein